MSEEKYQNMKGLLLEHIDMVVGLHEAERLDNNQFLDTDLDNKLLKIMKTCLKNYDNERDFLVYYNAKLIKIIRKSEEKGGAKVQAEMERLQQKVEELQEGIKKLSDQ